MKKTFLLNLVLIPIMFLIVGWGDTSNEEVTIPDIGIPVAQTQPPAT